MKRGLFVILFVILVLFISGQQSCEPAINIGTQNTCCKLSSGTNVNCINDIAQSGCDSLYSKYSDYYTQEIFQTNLENSCNDVSGCSAALSCKYLEDIYQSGDKVCLTENSKIYQCNGGESVDQYGCSASQKGDVYRDGLIDQNDLDCITKYILSQPLPAGCVNIMCGDVAGSDNTITTLDSSCIGNYISGSGCTFAFNSVSVDQAWAELTDCSGSGGCVNTAPCTNPSITGTACSTGLCGEPSCVPQCTYANECSETGIDETCGGLNNLCDRDTDGNGCSTSGASGSCLNGDCTLFDTKNVKPGYYHSCALISDGTIKCWGRDDNGQLGDGGAISDINKLIRVPVSGINNAIDLAVGANHNCAVLSDGAIRCWGNNPNSQIGDGTLTDRSAPVLVSGISNAVAVSAGISHSCAVLSDGAIKCWGAGGEGQLGNGGTPGYSNPVLVSGINNAVDVSVWRHSCALLSDNTIKCWGFNSEGQLGDGTLTSRSTPVLVSGINNAVSVSAGSQHSCAALSDNTIKCWGSDDNGQLGDDATLADKSTPVSVSGINNAVGVAVGSTHSCASLSDGSLKCWGLGISGQLGDGTTISKSTPVSVSGTPIAGVSMVGGGGGMSNTCIALSNGRAKCWGSNYYGQIGDNTTVIKWLAPRQVYGI